MPDSCQIELRNRGICVIIPAYNNAGTVAEVVTRAQNFCADVYVVLDGCTDDSRALLENLPEKPVIIDLPKNKGKGKALKAGFKAALRDGFAYAITLDADGQHYPEDIPLFLNANRRNPGALIVGRRMDLDKTERSGGSKFANAFSNFWFFLQTLIPLKDTQTGYRLYPLRKVRRLPALTSRYEAELELLVFSAWRGVRITSQDVHVYYPSREERVTHFRPFTDFARISLLNVALCLLALVYGLPRTILRWLIKVLLSFLFIVSYMLVTGLVVTPGIFLFMSIGRKTDKKKEKLHRFIRRFVSLGQSLLFGRRFTLAGEEDFSQPAIITCNHQSHLDLIPILSMTHKLVILTADWVWHNPVYGYVIRQADFLPASLGLDAILPRLKEIVAKGYSIVVYPESTRSVDCSIGRVHQGAFYLAEQLDLPILPAILYGTGHALPKNKNLINCWPVRLELDKRISREELVREGGESLKSQASYMRQYYMKRYAQLADKIEQTL